MIVSCEMFILKRKDNMPISINIIYKTNEIKQAYCERRHCALSKMFQHKIHTLLPYCCTLKSNYILTRSVDFIFYFNFTKRKENENKNKL